MSLIKDVIGYGTHTDRPVAGHEGRLYFETDTGILFRDTAGTWEAITLSTTTPPSGAVTKLDEVTVGALGAANISFSGIDPGYNNLQLTLHARGDDVGTTTDVTIQFNADTGANYDWQWVWAYDSTPGGSDAAAQTAIVIAAIAAAGAPALAADYADLFIPNYANTVLHKSLRGLSSKKLGSVSGNLLTVALSGWWHSTAAINAILLTPASGNFVEGSKAVLYGTA